MNWESGIEEIKRALKSRENFQMKIAEIAVMLCQPRRGGVPRQDGKTLGDLARAVDIQYKTLLGWVDVYKSVFEKVKDLGIVPYETLRVVRSRVTPASTSEQIKELIKKHQSVPPSDATAIKYASILKSFLTMKNLEMVKDETLEEALYYLEKIKRRIKDHRPEIKPKNHAIISRKAYDSKRIGESADIMGDHIVNGKRVCIRAKEQRIFDEMKEHKDRKWTPTVLAAYAGKESSWAIGGLNNLIKTGFVKKEKQGVYILTGKGIEK